MPCQSLIVCAFRCPGPWKNEGKKKVHSRTHTHTPHSVVFFFFISFLFFFACLDPIPGGFKSSRSALFTVLLFFSDLALHLHPLLLPSTTIITSVTGYLSPDLTATYIQDVSTYLPSTYQCHTSPGSPTLLHLIVHRPAWLLAPVSRTSAANHTTLYPRQPADETNLTSTKARPSDSQTF